MAHGPRPGSQPARDKATLSLASESAPGLYRTLISRGGDSALSSATLVLLRVYNFLSCRRELAKPTPFGGITIGSGLVEARKRGASAKGCGRALVTNHLAGHFHIDVRFAWKAEAYNEPVNGNIGDGSGGGSVKKALTRAGSQRVRVRHTRRVHVWGHGWNEGKIHAECRGGPVASAYDAFHARARF